MRVPVSLLRDYVSFKVSIDTLAERLTFCGFEVEEILDVEGEKVFEINVTPNRGDALSVLGMAREVSAILQVPLKQIQPVRAKTVGKSTAASSVKVSNQAIASCSRYTLTAIDGVRIAPSPEWLQKKLRLFGIRPINNIVDVTNLVLMELGQPMHAFDASRLAGRKVLIRHAHNGEKMTTLDGQERALITDDLVIADENVPIALAGVMGGQSSEISNETTHVFLEVANFHPATLRKTARRLGLRTESSYRFERGVDPNLDKALARATELILEVAGGQVVARSEYAGRPLKPTIINFNPQEASDLLGIPVSVTEAQKILKRLFFTVKAQGKGRLKLTIPTFRGDVTRSVDVIEEIFRLSGIENLKESFPTMSASPLIHETSRDKLEDAKKHLKQAGLHETIHFSFLSPDDVSLWDPSLLDPPSVTSPHFTEKFARWGFGGESGFSPEFAVKRPALPARNAIDHTITLANPLGREFSVMRPNLLISLLKTMAYHHRHKMFDARFFEARSVFRREEGTIVETKRLAGIVSGKKTNAHWSDVDKKQETDFFEMKGLIESLLADLKISFSWTVLQDPSLHPSQQLGLTDVHGAQSLGSFGRLHPNLLSRFDLKRSCYVFDLNWDILGSLKRDVERYVAYSKSPVVERDLAVVVDESMTGGEIETFLKNQDAMIQGVRLFDLYRGQPIPAGKKSLAFSIQIGKADQTLTEEEINRVFGHVVENVKRQFQGELR